MADFIDHWARRRYAAKYGDRAAAIAAVCRRSGLRDLVIKVSDIPECIPKLAVRIRMMCQGGGHYAGAGATTPHCQEPAALCVVTDSGLELFFCESHAQERVVRLPV